MNDAELLALATGQGKKFIIKDTAELAGRFRLVHIITDAVFTVLEDDNLMTGSGDFTGTTYPAGAVIGGNFTNIKLASGVVIAYS